MCAAWAHAHQNDTLELVRRAWSGTTSTCEPVWAGTMHESDLGQRYRLMQRYVGWSADDAQRVAQLSPLVLPRAADLIADFYAEIRRHSEAARVITGGSEQIKRLSKSLEQWLIELLTGEYDDAYMARRWKVGHRHVEIGLAQRFTSLALSRLRTGIVEAVSEGWRGPGGELKTSLQSLHKLIDLEHALIQDAYEFEHVRRERELERIRGERRFRHLVESASCLIIILDADHSLLYFNPFAERTTGCAATELAEQAGSVLGVLGQDWAETVSRINSVIAGHGPMSYEDQCTKRNGPTHWINWTLSRISEFDERPALLAVGHDVTELKQAAQELLQSSRLATIGEMYTRLAHESRNALQRLGACMEMLADQVGDQSPLLALVNRAHQAQDDLRRLLDEVRNFAAPLTLERTECRIAALWREAWGLLGAARQGRTAELQDGGCELLRPASADRFRVVQAFRNIFENALAACTDPIVIRVQCAEILLGDRSAMEIIVDDNGPGFSSEALHRAFEPFFTTKSTGTGLGLAIVHRIVEAHGGHVTAARNESGGARICIQLPCNPVTM